MLGNLERPAAVGRASLEVGKNVLPAPAVDSVCGPAVVVGAVAPDYHLGVDRRRAAEHLATRDVDLAPRESLLRDRRVAPVDVRAVELRERGRDPDLTLPVFPARLEEEHADRRVLAEPGGEDAPRRPRTDDHVVRHGSWGAALCGLSPGHPIPPPTADP